MKSKIDEILKAAFTTSDLATGGLLEPDQSARFVQGIFENAVVSPEARRVPMRANKRVIDKITFTGPILQKPVAVGTEHTTTTKPVTTKVTLDAKEIIMAIDLGYDSLEDSIEGANIEQSILDMASRRVAFELDELILQGDVGGGSGDFLEILDGLFLQVTTNISPAGEATLSEIVLNDAIQRLPGQFLQNEGTWRWWVSHKARLDYVQALAAKNVNTAFERFLVDNGEPFYMGIPVRKVGAIRQVSTGFTPTDEGSTGLLMLPSNVVLGIHRDISFEMERKPRKRVLEVTMTMRADVKLEREDAAVKITLIKHSVK